MKGKSNSWLIAIIVILTVIILLMGSVFVLIFYPINRYFGTFNMVPENTDIIKPVRSVSEIIESIAVLPNISSEVDITLSESEITLLITTFLDESDKIVLVDDIKIKCNRDQTIDIYATTKNMDSVMDNAQIPDFLRGIVSAANNKPVYLNVSIAHIEGNNFLIEINDARLQSLPLPVSMFESVQESLSKSIESQLNAIKGFNTKHFSIQEGSMTFRGIIGASDDETED